MATRGAKERLLDSELIVLETFFRQPAGWAATAAEITKAAGRLSPTTVGKGCKALASRRLLHKRHGKSRTNGVPTSSYSLATGPRGLRDVVAGYLVGLAASPGGSMRASLWFLGTRAANDLLTTAFVRAELERKGVRAGQSECERELLLPIAALCHVSPMALATFLGRWKPYRSAVDTPMAEIEHVLFRMVFDAIQDLSLSRDTPSGSPVKFATVCPERGGCVPGASTLLELDWGEDTRIGYAAGFDTDHMIVFGEDVEAGGVEVERNPENAWVKIATIQRELPPWLARHRSRTGSEDLTSDRA